MEQNLFKKYHDKLFRESVLKACLCGLIIGGGVLAVTALLSWLFGFKAGLFLALGLGVASGVVSGFLFYRFKFRPTTRAIAKRVDELGLEERLLTMIELENDDSYMARLQREDAQKAMSRLDPMLLKVAVSVSLIVAVAAVGVCGVGMTTVGSLYYADAIPSGVELLSKEEVVLHTFECTYSVYKEYANEKEVRGYIVEYNGGDYSLILDGTDSISYTIDEGGSSPAIYAVPAAGYVFVGWTDGGKSPYRIDENISHPIVASAMFEPVQDTLGGDYVIDELPKGNDDDDSSFPPPPDSPPTDPTPPLPNDKNYSHDSADQQITNGNTYYGDELGNAQQNTSDRFDQDGNIPDNMKDLVGDYYDGIDKGNNGSGSGSGSGSGGSDAGSSGGN